MLAMRAFAECAEVLPEPIGYCHDAINDARFLANHDVCMGAGLDDPATPDVDETVGATSDIGFHIRIPCKFPCNMPHYPLCYSVVQVASCD